MRIAAAFVALLLFLFFLASSFATNAQERTDLIDAPPLWPRLLGFPLETIAIKVHAVGDLPPEFDRNLVEAECLKYLQEALASTPDIKVVLYTDMFLNILLKREAHSYGGTVAIQYGITVKEWRKDAKSAVPVLLGAVELDVEQPFRPPRAGPVLDFPVELFLARPDQLSLRQALIAAIETHMDRHVIAAVRVTRAK